MKTFLAYLKKSFTLGIGITFSLIAIAFTFKIIEDAVYVYATFFFGVIGFSMLIAGALKIINDNKN